MEREGYQVVNTMRVPAHGWERLVSRRLDWGPELQPRSRESPPPRSLPARHPPSPPRWAQLTYFPRISPPTARTPPTFRGSVGLTLRRAAEAAAASCADVPRWMRARCVAAQGEARREGDAAGRAAPRSRALSCPAGLRTSTYRSTICWPPCS